MRLVKTSQRFITSFPTVAPRVRENSGNVIGRWRSSPSQQPTSPPRVKNDPLQLKQCVRARLCMCVHVLARTHEVVMCLHSSVATVGSFRAPMRDIYTCLHNIGICRSCSSSTNSLNEATYAERVMQSCGIMALEDEILCSQRGQKMDWLTINRAAVKLKRKEDHPLVFSVSSFIETNRARNTEQHSAPHDVRSLLSTHKSCQD